MAPRHARAGVNVVLDRMRFDATRHIRYTAELIDAASRNGRAMVLGDVVAQRTRDLASLTMREIGEPARSGTVPVSDVSGLAPRSTRLAG
jgi:hypothetical protein